jgi:hypothetical protein
MTPVGINPDEMNEIRERHSKAERWRNGDSGAHYILADPIVASSADVPTLIAEIERLKSRNDILLCYAMETWGLNMCGKLPGPHPRRN